MRGETSAIRFSEATKLLDYGFSNFEYVKYSNNGDTLKTINVEKGIRDNVNVIFEKDAGCLIHKGQGTNITTTVNLKDNFEAPIREGQILGTVTYTMGEETLGSVNLISANEVKKLNLGNMMASVLDRWINLLR